MRVLVTGGCGFIGSVLVPALLKRKHKVTIVDNLLYEQGHTQTHLLNTDVEFINKDMREMIGDRFMAKFDAIIHLAALVGAPACAKNPNLCYELNERLTLMLMGAMSHHQRLIYPNTNSGYGTVRDAVCTEETPINPISLYGTAKQTGEVIVMTHPRGTSFRLATVYGPSPRMRLDLLVNQFVYRAMFDGQIEVFDGELRRNFVHVSDVAEVMATALDDYRMVGEVFNLGDDEANKTKKKLAQFVAAQTPGFVNVVDGTGSDPDQRDYVVSSKKLAGLMDSYEFDFVPFTMGVNDVIAWCRGLPKDKSIRESICSRMNTTCSLRL